MRQLVRALRFRLLRARTRACVSVGENVWFGAGAVLAAPDFISVGDNVAFGRGFHVETNLTVGDDVLISSGVAIVGNDHRFDDPTVTVFWQGRATPDTVVLEGDNLVGFGTVIVGSLTVGRGAIIGARSVVTRDLPAGFICAGCPARPMRPRYGPRDHPA